MRRRAMPCPARRTRRAAGRTPLPIRPMVRTVSPRASQRGADRLGPAGLHHQDHADAAIEGAQQLHGAQAAGSGQPGEHRRQRPGCEIEVEHLAVGEHARRVLDQPAAGDVRQGLHAAGGDRGEAARRRRCGSASAARRPRLRPACQGQGSASSRPCSRSTRRTSEKPLAWIARRGEAEHDVALGDQVAARQDAAALDGTDGEAGEIEVAAAVEARHLRGLAADQRAAGQPAALADPGDDLAGHARAAACRSRNSRGRTRAARPARPGR